MQFDLNKSIEILERTPKLLNVFLSDLSYDWIYSNEGEHTWSPFDVVGHLIHGEKTDWIIRLKLILSDGELKTFEPFDRYAQFEASQGKTLNQLLEEFQELRTANIKYLKSLHLSEVHYNQKAIHPDLGEVNLKQLLATWVTHDLGHIAQVARVLAKQYKDEVGPWTAYISILNK